MAYVVRVNGFEVSVDSVAEVLALTGAAVPTPPQPMPPTRALPPPTQAHAADHHAGTISRSGRHGWRWQVMRGGRRTNGPSYQTQEEAAASLAAFLAGADVQVPARARYRCGRCGADDHTAKRHDKVTAAAAAQPPPAPAEDLAPAPPAGPSPGRGELLADQRGGALDDPAAPPPSAFDDLTPAREVRAHGARPEIIDESDDAPPETSEFAPTQIETPRAAVRRLCKRCHQPGHNARSCGDRPVDEAESKGGGPVTPAMQSYLKAIRAYPILSREKEFEIATRFAATGDPALAKQLVQANLRFVVSIALSYTQERAKLLDLIQEGNLGLMHAVTKFDPFRGNKLTTYSQPWIKAYIQRHILNSKRLVRIGKTQGERTVFYGLNKARRKLEAIHKREPSIAELAAEMKVPEKVVESMSVRLGASEGTIERRVGDDQDPQDWIADTAPTPDAIVEQSHDADRLRQTVDAVRAGLSLRERCILDSRLTAEDPVTLDSLSVSFGVTRERVRQIEKNLKEKLAQRLRDRLAEAA